MLRGDCFTSRHVRDDVVIEITTMVLAADLGPIVEMQYVSVEEDRWDGGIWRHKRLWDLNKPGDPLEVARAAWSASRD